MPPAIYVDVDDTLIRAAGRKSIPIPASIALVRELFAAGGELYLWSTGGADYARRIADELGIAECFRAFLPKPSIIIDDQAVTAWRGLKTLHPLALNETARELLGGQ